MGRRKDPQSRTGLGMPHVLKGRLMRFLPVVVVVSVLALFLTGCGGSSSSSSSSTAVTVTLSPTAVTLTPNQTTQFVATVTNATNTAVNWQVNGISGGNTSVGVISSSGLYTAPSTILVTSSVTVQAISQQDTTVTATATVTLTPTSTAPQAPVLLSPPSATLAAGAQQTFTATVSGTVASVTWSVSCPATNVSDCGSITQSGIYTAPFFPPPSGSVSVTATSKDGTGLPGNAPVVITISNQSLFGSYAFSVAGTNGGNPVAIAGSITFDGQGNVTGGSEDIAGSAGPIAITGGTYHVGTDGRGNVTVTTASGSAKWMIVMQNHSRAAITGFDTGTNVVNGSMDLQTPAQFTAASITGNYGLSLQGISAAHTIGTFRGVGAFTADGVSAITGGRMDLNDTGTAQTALAVAGTFTAPSNIGRGTLTLTSGAGTQTFVYYMANGTRLKLVETDALAKATAEAVTQATGPFTASSIKGSFATAVIGLNGNSAPTSMGAILTLDGTATVKATLDTNNNGNTALSQSVTGSYAMTDTTTGRTTFSWTANDGVHQYVLYPAANQDLNILEIDSSSASGPALFQKFVVSNSSYASNYVTAASGVDFTATPGPEALSGLLVFNGGSAISGALDVNDNGALTASGSVRGSYAFDATGRATLNVTSGPTGLATAQMAMYAADDSRAVYINIDSNRVLSGIILKQY
jgi:hypothetical protein